jgi:hypothetical protein
MSAVALGLMVRHFKTHVTHMGESEALSPRAQNNAGRCGQVPPTTALATYEAGGVSACGSSK